MFKFIHTADIHLDSPLLNLDRYEGAPVEAFRGATRRAFDNIVELAIAQDVKFVLIAGDLYDGECRDVNTPLHFRRRMNELDANGIRVFVIQGNHDADNKMQKALKLPDNVHVFRTDRPGTVRIDDLRVAVHGQGFARRDVAEDLSQHYPDPLRGCLNIGMLHTSCGIYEGHDRYAPSTIRGLTAKGYDYWALGHIHKRATLAGPNPRIIYPGNPQGRHIREQGPRGCVLATVEDDRVTKTEWRDMDVLRWQLCSIDAAECNEADAIVAEVETETSRLIEAAGDRPLAVRIEVTGATPAHRHLTRHADHWDRRLREAMLDRFDDRVWVEKIKFRTRPAAGVTAWQLDDPLGQLLEGIADVDSLDAALDEIRGDYQQLLKELRTDPRMTETALSLEDEGGELTLSDEIVSDVKDLLVGHLLESGDRA